MTNSERTFGISFARNLNLYFLLDAIRCVLAFDPNILYLILSLAPADSGLPYITDKTQPVLNAFHIENGEVERIGVLLK